MSNQYTPIVFKTAMGTAKMTALYSWRRVTVRLEPAGTKGRTYRYRAELSLSEYGAPVVKIAGELRDEFGYKVRGRTGAIVRMKSDAAVAEALNARPRILAMVWQRAINERATVAKRATARCAKALEEANRAAADNRRKPRTFRAEGPTDANL